MGKHLLIIFAFLVNGVCVIAQNFTPSASPDSTKITLRSPLMLQSNPLFIVNAGDRTLQILPAMKDHHSFSLDMNDIKDLNDINPRWIQSVWVIKGQDAIDKYGTLGQYGVIIIELMDNAFDKMPAHLAERFKIK